MKCVSYFIHCGLPSAYLPVLFTSKYNTITSSQESESAAQHDMHMQGNLVQSPIESDYENRSFSQKLKEATIKDIFTELFNHKTL